MAKQHKCEVPHRQAHFLFQIAANFQCPEKLGETSYNIADRGLAEEDALKLFRHMKGMTQDYDPAKELLRFGIRNNWKKSEINGGGEGWLLVDAEMPVELVLGEDSHMGAYWCLLLAIHPASPLKSNVRVKEEILWPLAEKLRLTNMVRKNIGLDKAEHKRLELDGDEEETEKKNDKATAPANA